LSLMISMICSQQRGMRFGQYMQLNSMHRQTTKKVPCIHACRTIYVH
jgi:hypothetical protein